MKRHYAILPWRNTARLARLLSLLGKHAMFVQAIFAHFGRQNRLFEQNATEREKTQDWLAERIGFELIVAFLRTIAPYWPAKCVFRLSAANGETKPENRGDCTVHDRQCEPKYQFVFFRVRIASLGEGPIRRDFTVSAHTDLSVDKTGQED